MVKYDHKVIDKDGLDFGVYSYTQYITLRDIRYNNIIIPKAFPFDGISMPWYLMCFFTHNDLKRGIKASCFHDWMCQHKSNFQRKEATSILLKIWKNAGLGNRWYTSWKPWIVYIFVDLYQMRQGGWR